MSQSNWIGKTIGGRYEIQELLGQGGMSAVYKASDPNLRRVVAVKLIHSHLSSDPEFVRRFEEEAAAVASLRHPNIIQVFDFNNDGDTFYIVFEFIPGETLQDNQTRIVKAGRQVPLDQSLALSVNVADALAYAHERGVIHRDVKPANVMINVHNQAILMDFGLVKIAGGDSHTATGAVMGTARYMSPEQIRGERVDERTDIYSLGVMMYEMAAGRPPFHADSALTLMMMHVNDPVPDLREIRPDVPATFVQVIGKTLAKDKADRFLSAGELAEALRSIDLDGDGAIAPAVAVAAVASTTMPGGEKAQPKPVAVVKPVEATDPGSPVASPPMPPPPQAQVPSAPPASTPAKDESSKRIVVIAGIAIALLLVLCIGGAAIIFGTGILSGDDNGQEAGDGTLVADNPAVIATESGIVDEPEETATMVVATETVPPPTATSTVEPTEEPTEEATVQPSPTTQPAPTTPPTPTTPTGPAVQIIGITAANGVYAVDYYTYGYTPALPNGEHIHFFFDTVLPVYAGLPGSGPWLIYAGPVPFTGYSINDRPAGANQMCALVANADHSVQLETGNCYALPQ